MKYYLWFAIFVLNLFNEVHLIACEEQKSEVQPQKENSIDADNKGFLKLESNKTLIDKSLNRRPEGEILGKDPKQDTPNPVAVVAISAVAAATQKLVETVSGVVQSINRLNSNFHLNMEAARLAPTTPTTSTTPKPTTPTSTSTTSNSSEITDYDEDTGGLVV